jgi:hypothetical protein
VLPLGDFFGHQGQIRGYQSLFLITDITGIGFARHCTASRETGYAILAV